LERLDARETDGIVVMSLNRVASTAKEADAVYRGIVLDGGRIFASCVEGLDSRTPRDTYVDLLLAMPPPHPEHVLDVRELRARRTTEASEGSKVKRTSSSSPQNKSGSVFRQLLTVAIPSIITAAAGWGKSEPPPPPPTPPPRVQIYFGANGTVPPDSDYKQIDALLLRVGGQSGQSTSIKTYDHSYISSNWKSRNAEKKDRG
jgi:hypothetical protein